MPREGAVINYDFTYVPTIKAFVQSRKKYKFIVGPFGSGKSSGCVIHLLLSATQQEPDRDGVRSTRYAIIRNTGKQLTDTTKKTIDDWLPPTIATWKESKFKYEITFALEDGTVVKSEWLLRALDNPEQVRDLLSLELTGAWMNEGREIRWEIFSALRGRIGRYPPKRIVKPTYPFIIIDSNPPSTEHWLYKFFEEKPQEDEHLRNLVAVFHQPSGLSPDAENLPNLPDHYYEDLMVGQDEDWIKVHVHGEYGYTRSGKPVFTAYSDSFHCAKEELKPIRGLPLLIGMDFGLNPSVCFGQKSPDGRLFIIDELTSLEPTDLKTFIVERFKPLVDTKYFGMDITIIGDPAGSQRSQVDKRTCFMLLREYGFRAYPAWTNSLHDRIRAVNDYLTRVTKDGQPAFLISPSCKTLRRGLISEYKFRRLRVQGERYSEFPEKNLYSHIADALQYLCLGYRPNSSMEINRVLPSKRYTFRSFV